MTLFSLKSLTRMRFSPSLLVVLLLAGCSAVQFGYRHADTFLAWTVDDFFDLDHGQKELLKPGIESLLAWHRTEQLPDYARFLEANQARLGGPVTHADVKWLVDEARARYITAVERAVVEGAPVLAKLSSHQIDELEQRLKKDNRKFADKFLMDDLAKRQRKRAERFIDIAEYWVGSLSDEQEKRIVDITAEGETGYTQRLAERQRVQREFLAILREDNSAGSLVRKLKVWIANWEAGRTAETEQAFARADEQRLGMMLAVTDTLGARQREHAQKRLRSYAEDIRKLAVMPPT
jgi:hypothetical protein